MDAAGDECLKAWAHEHQQPARDAADGSDDPPWTAGLEFAGSLDVHAVAESTRRLYYLAMDAIDRLAEAGLAVEQATAETVHHHGADRFVSVAVTGGRVVAVDFDQSWLKRATAAQITRRPVLPGSSPP